MKKALVIVDIQNDFADPAGSLYVPGGEIVAHDTAEYVRATRKMYDLVVRTADWHPGDHPLGGHIVIGEQEPNPEIGLWPAHGIQGSWGALFHPEIQEITDLVDADFIKGMNGPAYSAFQGFEFGSGISFNDYMQEHNIEWLDVCGLAAEYCVKESGLSGLEFGYFTTIIPGLTAAVFQENLWSSIEEVNGPFNRE